MGGECVGVSDGVEVSRSLMNVGGKGGGKKVAFLGGNALIDRPCCRRS